MNVVSKQQVPEEIQSAKDIEAKTCELVEETKHGKRIERMEKKEKKKRMARWPCNPLFALLLPIISSFARSDVFAPAAFDARELSDHCWSCSGFETHAPEAADANGSY